MIALKTEGLTKCDRDEAERFITSLWGSHATNFEKQWRRYGRDAAGDYIEAFGYRRSIVYAMRLVPGRKHSRGR